jgi:hypothetical protein
MTGAEKSVTDFFSTLEDANKGQPKSSIKLSLNSKDVNLVVCDEDLKDIR